ncbi:acyltransferase family protein [Microbacterium sp. TWP3-1-2b2]|uniref:acyltransferase family protein n=1 Tax=Microbacterium sp. TWP3-1-2b2 TaxID=2804651 RepID=UPI003CECB972
MTRTSAYSLKDNRYLPQLDGLRAFAVIAVLAYHSHLPLTQGGYVGVDVFFVLSGYLITTILLTEISATGRIRFGVFYAKRALRLFPALLLVCIVIAAVWAAVPWAPTREATLVGVPAAISYLSSWVRAFDLSTLGYLGHTWSLSVEEHFYLLWPLCLFLAIKITKHVRMSIVLIMVLAVVYQLIAPALGWSFDRVYNGSDTRAFQILIGCALAALLPRLTRISLWAALIAVLALVAAFFFMPYESPIYLFGGAVVVGFATAIIIGHVVLNERRVTAFLSLRPFVWIGKRSYGIYLWHYPIFGILAASTLPFLLAAGLGVTFSIVIPALSYRYVESPFLRLKNRFARARKIAVEL